MLQVTSLPKSVEKHLLKRASNSQIDFFFPVLRSLELGRFPLHAVHAQSSSAESKPSKPLVKSAATPVIGEAMTGCSPRRRWSCRTEGELPRRVGGKGTISPPGVLCMQVIPFVWQQTNTKWVLDTQGIFWCPGKQPLCPSCYPAWVSCSISYFLFVCVLPLGCSCPSSAQLLQAPGLAGKVKPYRGNKRRTVPAIHGAVLFLEKYRFPFNNRIYVSDILNLRKYHFLSFIAYPLYPWI